MRFNIYACNGGEVPTIDTWELISKINNSENFALNEILSAINMKTNICL